MFHLNSITMEKFLFEINIGLNNNPFSFNQIRKEADAYLQVVDVREDIGQYVDSPEPTAVLLVLCSKETIEEAVRIMCSHFTQECIPFRPFKDDSNGVLVYNSSYIGEKYVYDSQYFIPFFKNN